MSLLNNPWVIGIGGGLLSGLLVTAISRLLLSRRENREYRQKVYSANREIIYSIRPGISEGIIPTPEVIKSLIVATARKYAVETKDVYGPTEIVQELLKEVMDSSFISAKTKEEYCTRLIPLAHVTSVGPGPDVTAITQSIDRTRVEMVAHYRQRLTWTMSTMMGVLAALMTGLFALFQTSTDSKDHLPEILKWLFDRSAILLPTLISILAVVFALWFLMFERSVARRREARRRDKESDEPDSNVESDKDGP